MILEQIRRVTPSITVLQVSMWKYGVYDKIVIKPEKRVKMEIKEIPT